MTERDIGFLIRKAALAWNEDERKDIHRLASRITELEEALKEIVMAEPKMSKYGFTYWASFSGELQNIAARALRDTTND